MVPAVPPFAKYVHMGSEVLIDGLGDTGNIIINPSSVEKALIQKTKSSVMGHLLGAYKNGLQTIKLASGVTDDDSLNIKATSTDKGLMGNNSINPQGNENQTGFRPILQNTQSVRNIARSAMNLQKLPSLGQVI